MLQFTDQLNKTIRLENYPKRIVSLVPSQTELLFDLGLEKEVVGITKFCIHPNEWFKNKTRVGGTKNVNFKIIDTLKPDLIIANKEENTKEDIELLQKKYNVWISDIYNLTDALTMINNIGKITNTENKSLEIIKEINSEFNTLKNLQKTTKKVAYFIWKNPYMLAGKNTFIDDMLMQCGLINTSTDLQNRYPEINQEELIPLNPDLVFLSSEPYPFKQKHINEIKQFLPRAHIELVDGELFSWYGSRLTKSAKYFAKILKNSA